MSGQDQAGVAVPEPGTSGTGAGAGQGQRMLAGRYELGDRLGRGGMGTVWRARDLMLDREVAVKELTVNHLPEEDLAILQSRMKQEARAAARIKHPGVITIHDVLEQDGRPWIVMELIDGRSLADVMAQDGPLAPREAAEVGAQVLAALHRGHQLGVLHRDVKPANVLLERGTGRAVLLDFGIAKFEGSSELTRPGDLVGSPDYLAPERAQGERPGPASDLWGLGATLYAAVEGQSPFRRDSPLNTLAAVVADPLPVPVRAGALGPVLAALLAKDAADRPSADEALRMLREVTAGHTMDITPAPRVVQQRTPTQMVPVVDRQSAEEVPLSSAQQEAVAPTEVRPVAAGPELTRAEPVRTEAGRPRGRRKGLLLVLAGLTAALVGGAVALVATGALHDRATASGGGPTQASSTLPDQGTASPLAPGSAPAGYTWTTDDLGFGFPLPTTGGTWQRTVTNNNIYYSPDDKNHLIQFAVSVGQSEYPLQHLSELEGKVRQNSVAYHRETLVPTKVHGQEAAQWVWTYNQISGPAAGPREVIEVEYRDAEGTGYAILASGPAKEWTTTQQWLAVVLNGFKPTAPGSG